MTFINYYATSMYSNLNECKLYMQSEYINLFVRPSHFVIEFICNRFPDDSMWSRTFHRAYWVNTEPKYWNTELIWIQTDSQSDRGKKTRYSHESKWQAGTSYDKSKARREMKDKARNLMRVFLWVKQTWMSSGYIRNSSSPQTHTLTPLWSILFISQCKLPDGSLWFHKRQTYTMSSDSQHAWIQMMLESRSFMSADHLQSIPTKAGDQR